MIRMGKRIKDILHKDRHEDLTEEFCSYVLHKMIEKEVDFKYLSEKLGETNNNAYKLLTRDVLSNGKPMKLDLSKAQKILECLDLNLRDFIDESKIYNSEEKEEEPKVRFPVKTDVNDHINTLVKQGRL